MPVATSSVRKNTKVHYASTAQLLPPELWSAILNQLAASDLQSVIVALSRALPAAEGIKETNKLFRHIVLLRDNQATQLILKLRRLDPDVAQRAKEAACSVTGLAWRTDSDILVNLVNLLPALRVIDVNVGPLFAPEHLELLVENQRSTLQRLSLRFNPYVDKASYTIFLKGIYFDTGILKFLRWPITPSFRQLSLIQDPIPSFKDLVEAAIESGVRGPDKSHAQPIVFFKLSCLSTLATAPVAAHISAVRLRIPGRSILTAISTASTGGNTVIPATHSATLPKPFPALEFLDISTTYVNCDAALQSLFKRHSSLQYLVADRSGLIRFGMAEQTCMVIGRLISSVGVNRAQEATKVYKAAARAQNARAQQLRQQQQQALALENANGYVNGRPTELQRLVNSEVTMRRGGRSSYATERRNRRGDAGADGSADGLADAFANIHVSSVTKPIILPSAPTLLSLACGVNPHPELDDDMRQDWDEEFQAGYEEGLERTTAFLQEKLEEYARLTVRAQNATHKSSAEDRMFPKLYRFRRFEERQALIAKAARLKCALEDLHEDYPKDDILASMDLVPCTEIDAKHLLDEIREAKCVLCTLPDCAAEGRIAWTDKGEKDEKERRKWRKPESEHRPGCAHIRGRRIWEEGEGTDL